MALLTAAAFDAGVQATRIGLFRATPVKQRAFRKQTRAATFQLNYETGMAAADALCASVSPCAQEWHTNT